jgi:hypothetical protein
MQVSRFPMYGIALASLVCLATRSLGQSPATGPSASPSVLMSQDDKAPVAPAKKGKKEKPLKLTPLTIVHGVLTVDGWTAKADLNYAISDIKFLYVWVPGTGTFVISNKEFPGSAEMKDGFDGTMLTVTADKHKVQVISDQPLLQKKKESAFVWLDRGYKDSARAPRLGYGDKPVGPYIYPGALVNTSSQDAEQIPASMRPAIATKTTCETLSDGLQGDCKTTALTMAAASTKTASVKTLR